MSKKSEPHKTGTSLREQSHGTLRAIHAPRAARDARRRLAAGSAVPTDFSTRNRRRSKARTSSRAQLGPEGRPPRVSDGPASPVLTPLAGSGGLGGSWAPFPLLPLAPIADVTESWCFEPQFMSEERRPPEDHRRRGLASDGWAGECRGFDASGSAAGLVAVMSTDLCGHGRREWQGAN